MHRIIKGAIIAATSLIAIGAGSAAHASVEVTDGYGWVGKGDVQTVLNMNNSALQKAVDKGEITFTIRQSGSEAYSQSASQTATQTGTQSASQTGTKTGSQTATQELTEVLSCIKNGNPNQAVRHGIRTDTRTDTVSDTVTATRTATRQGLRDGVRTGSRAGVLNGTVVSAVEAPARKTGQWTGWNLKGLTGESTFAPTGEIIWNDPATFGNWDFPTRWTFGADFTFAPYQFGEYDFDAYDFGPIVWGAWNTDGTNADPDVCDNNGGGISNYSDVITEGDVVEGDVIEEDVVEGGVMKNAVVETGTTEHEITYGPTVAGDVTTSGSAALFVNGKALPNTPPAVPTV